MVQTRSQVKKVAIQQKNKKKKETKETEEKIFNNSVKNVYKNMITKICHINDNICIYSRNDKIKDIIELFKLFNNQYGKKLLNTRTNLKQTVISKIFEFYYEENVKEFYKIYRDLFGKRIPSQEFYYSHII